MIHIRVKNLERTFGTVRVLQGLNLEVRRGELVALYGPSGSGKTTLLNLIGALDRPTDGSIELDGTEITALSDRARTRLRCREMGFIFQSYTLLLTYNAIENIDITLRLKNIGFLERRRRIKAALQAVGLSAWAEHVPEELSGGQQQRIAIARALALQPALILADEPTSGLDTRTSRHVMHLFQGIARQQKTTFIMVSHDPMTADYVDTAYDLHDGRLIPRRR